MRSEGFAGARAWSSWIVEKLRQMEYLEMIRKYYCKWWSKAFSSTFIRKDLRLNGSPGIWVVQQTALQIEHKCKGVRRNNKAIFIWSTNKYFTLGGKRSSIWFIAKFKSMLSNCFMCKNVRGCWWTLFNWTFLYCWLIFVNFLLFPKDFGLISLARFIWLDQQKYAFQCWSKGYLQYSNVYGFHFLFRSKGCNSHTWDQHQVSKQVVGRVKD